MHARLLAKVSVQYREGLSVGVRGVLMLCIIWHRGSTALIMQSPSALSLIKKGTVLFKSYLLKFGFIGAVIVSVALSLHVGAMCWNLANLHFFAFDARVGIFGDLWASAWQIMSLILDLGLQIYRPLPADLAAFQTQYCTLSRSQASWQPTVQHWMQHR